MPVYAEYTPPINCRWVMFFLPLLSVFISTSAYVIAYVISVKVGSIDPQPYIPYFSEVNETSMSTLGLCISAIFNLAVLIVRYHQVKGVYSKPIKTNNISLYIGCMFVFGKIITASYKLSGNRTIHYCGYGTYMLSAFFYFSTQLYISRNYLPRTNKLVSFIRTLCCVTMVTGIIVYAAMATPYLSEFNDNGSHIAQIAQWSIVFTKCVFLLTFSYDFWKLGINIEIRKIPSTCDSDQLSVFKREVRGRYSVQSSLRKDDDDYDSVYFDERVSRIL